MSTIKSQSEKIFDLFFLCALLSLAGCRLGSGLSIGPEGSLFGIPVEIGHSQPPLSPAPRAGHVSESPIQQVGFEKTSDDFSPRTSLDATAQMPEKAWIKETPSVGKWQWKNPKMDELLLLPIGYRPDFEEILLTSPDSHIRANAAIVLAHREKAPPESLSQPLLDAIHSQLPTNMRCAALEAYTSLETTSASDLDEIFETS